MSAKTLGKFLAYPDIAADTSARPTWRSVDGLINSIIKGVMRTRAADRKEIAEALAFRDVQIQALRGEIKSLRTLVEKSSRAGTQAAGA